VGILQGFFLGKLPSEKQGRAFTREVEMGISVILGWFVAHHWMNRMSGINIESSSSLLSAPIIGQIQQWQQWILKTFYFMYPSRALAMGWFEWIPQMILPIIQRPKLVLTFLMIVAAITTMPLIKFMLNLLSESIILFFNIFFKNQIKPSDFGNDSATFSVFPLFHFLILLGWGINMYSSFSQDAWPAFLGSWKYPFYFILCIIILFVSQYFVTLSGMAVAIDFFRNSFSSSSTTTAAETNAPKNKQFRHFLFWVVFGLYQVFFGAWNLASGFDLTKNWPFLVVMIVFITGTIERCIKKFDYTLWTKVRKRET
jgi:hypothetical protein